MQYYQMCGDSCDKTQYTQLLICLLKGNKNWIVGHRTFLQLIDNVDGSRSLVVITSARVANSAKTKTNETGPAPLSLPCFCTPQCRPIVEFVAVVV